MTDCAQCEIYTEEIEKLEKQNKEFKQWLFEAMEELRARRRIAVKQKDIKRYTEQITLLSSVYAKIEDLNK